MVLAPTFGERGSFVPLGLAQLNAVLRRAGYVPSYHDLSEWLRREDPEFYAQLVKIGFSPGDGGFFGPDPLLIASAAGLEGVSHPLGEPLAASVQASIGALKDVEVVLMTVWDSNLPYVAALGAEARRRGKHVVCGGPGVELSPVRHALIRLGIADVVVRGEGEERLIPVLEALGDPQALSGIAGVCLPDRDEGSRDTPKAPDQRIHELPDPDFTGFPTDDWLPILTSRGCIRDCSFCTEAFVWARYRQRRVEAVLDEIEHRVRIQGVTRFEFNDDLLNGHIRWLEAFCDGIFERALDIRWICFMEPYRLSRSLLEKVEAAGCTLIKFGVQHLDAEMLRAIGRGDEIEDVVEVLATAAELGMRVEFDLIPGHPGETPEQHQVNCEGLPPILHLSERIHVNVNPFLLLHGAPVEQYPDRHGVAIERWIPADSPAALQGALGEHLHEFIRSFEGFPPPDVVASRVRDLEEISAAVGAMREGAMCLAEPDAVRSLSPRDPRAGALLRLRVPREGTPRSLLEAISLGRGRGFGSVVLETPGAPCEHPEWIALARRAGLSGVVVEGTEGALRVGPALRDNGMPWMARWAPDGDEGTSLGSLISEVAAAGALGLHLAVESLGLDRPSQRAADLLAFAEEGTREAARAGLHLRLTGLPACVLESPEETWSQEASWARPIDALCQPLRCQACAWEGRCEGLSPDLLAVAGDAFVQPVPTRPRKGGGDDPITRILF